MSRGRLFFISISLVVVAALLGGTLLAANARTQDGADSPYKYLSMFVEVLDLVRRAYVDETDTAVLMEGALEGATDALGPFALYVPADAFERFHAAEAIGDARSGMTVLKDRGVAFVAGVAAGSPAAEAGVERGDLLALINGRSTREMPLWEIASVLAGPIGSEIKLQRVRMGTQDDVTFTLDTFESSSVVLEARRGVAVLDVERIDDSTRGDVEIALATIGGRGEALPGLEKRDRLVIDLRDLIGGEPDAAYRVAGLFAKGELGTLTGRGETLETFSSAPGPVWTSDIVVLVNGGTQGAAEILASVLGEQPGIELVGLPTFGHSGRESLLELSNGDRLRMTTAYYSGPDGTPLTESLEPDLVVRPRGFALDPDDTRDVILERGLAVALGEESIDEEVEKAA